MEAYNDLVVTVGDENCQVWNLLDGQILQSFIEKRSIYRVSLSDGLIAIGAEESLIYIRRIRDGKLLMKIDVRKFQRSVT